MNVKWLAKHFVDGWRYDREVTICEILLILAILGGLTVGALE